MVSVGDFPTIVPELPPYIHNIPYQYPYHYHYHHLDISYLTLPYSTWHHLHISVPPLTATVKTKKSNGRFARFPGARQLELDH